MIPPTGAARSMERPADQHLTNTRTEQAAENQTMAALLTPPCCLFVVCIRLACLRNVNQPGGGLFPTSREGYANLCLWADVPDMQRCLQAGGACLATESSVGLFVEVMLILFPAHRARLAPSFAIFRRLERFALYMGFICSSHFAIILVPVSRDSKIWSVLGVPYERAVLYHTFAGHLAFTTLVLHALLFVVYWLWTEGWDHAVRQSIHAPAEKHHHGLDIPMGWMAFMCAIPMWITSLNFVRRRFYSLFKLAHFLFIGVFVFAAMHVRAGLTVSRFFLFSLGLRRKAFGERGVPPGMHYYAGRAASADSCSSCTP